MEFLNLPERHSEQELRRGLIGHLRDFLLELGRDFCFVGSEFLIQVGGRDFHLDLLLFHRELLRCRLDEFYGLLQPEG